MGVKVGFVGLGVMGGPMAGHLLKGGVDVVVWNRTPSKVEPLKSQGAKVAESLETMGAECDVIFLCVTKTEDVKECLGALTTKARAGSLFVDHSTIAPGGAKEIHTDMAAKGFRFVDAPITGGSMGAQKGQLTVFCGGDEGAIAEAMPFIQMYAKRAERVGGPGAGQSMKMANQIAVGGALLAMCETLSFAEKAGLDVAQARDMIGGGAGGSWAFENYGPKVLAKDWTPGFSVDNQRKDFAYCRDAATESNAAIPCTDLVDRLLAPLQEQGRGGDTTAALYDILMAMGAGG